MATYPRSGHGGSVRILGQYFGSDKFFHVDCHENHEVVPNLLRNTNCHKTHDLMLNVSQAIPNITYMVRIRTPLESIVSWFLLNLRKKIWGDVTKTEEDFMLFAERRINFWKQFVERWVFSPEAAGFELFCYHDFVEDPLREMKRCVVDVYGEEFDEEKMARVIESRGVYPRSDIRSFEYFSDSFFRDLEDRVRPEIERLGLPAYY